MLRLSLAFFCSGFAALLCQIAWQRMLGIFAGSDTVSAALVVGAFLAGLGLGSLLGARIADRLSPARALLGFVLCEVLVAGFALLSKLFLYDLLAMRLAGMVDDKAAIFALCFAGLLLPTVLMGASLPLVARAVATSLDTVAERIGWLYGLNTLGAGFGALAGGWVLLGTLGFVGTLAVAALLDLVAAALALSLASRLRRQEPGPEPAAAFVAAAAGGAAKGTGGSLPVWCGLVFLSGYVIVALEIIWIRVLGQVGQFHAYLFPTVLGVFLLADGLGMAVAARLVRRVADPRPAFFLLQAGGFLLGAALLLALWWALPLWPLGERLMPDNWRLGGVSFALTTLLVVAVVAPPSFLIGMTFPFVQRAVQQDLAQVGARVGWVQLANILGNAAGSLVTGLVALHLLGTAGTLVLAAGVSLLLALAWLAWSPRPARPTALAAAVGCAAALLAIPGNAAFWTRNHGAAPGSTHAWDEDRSGVAFWRESAVTSVQGQGTPGPFFIAGYAQATIPFLPLHMALGAAGPLLHPAPERVFLVGVGSGASPWGAAAVQEVKELRAVELVAPVLGVLRRHAALRPDGPVAALLDEPRLHLEAGDGRRALARSAPGSWDVIQADAVLPQTSHSGLLYSREYLELVRSRLTPGGLAVQWAPTWSVVETFLAVFPHVVMLRPANLLVGSDRPIGDARARLLEALAHPAVAAHLARGNQARAAEVVAEVSGPMLAWTPGAPRRAAPLTDLFPRDEFFRNNRVRDTWASEPPPELRPSHQGLAAGR